MLSLLLKNLRSRLRCLAQALLLSLTGLSALAAQRPATPLSVAVADAKGAPMAGVTVHLLGTQSHTSAEGVTDATGKFVFRNFAAEPSVVTATAQGLQAHIAVPAEGWRDPVRLVLSTASSNTAAGEMEFSDAPNFTVAGVTDWTAVGGHGSDATLRTSESLTTAMASLPKRGNTDTESADEMKLEAAIYEAQTQAQRAQVQVRVHAALQTHATATLYRLAAEADEANGDPLAAVREFAQAASIQPSETNEFAWGSELLLHRAILQALDVFTHGGARYPASVRMQTALGTAMFAAARYDEAAAQLCKASDMAPKEIDPYRFMGKVELASPNALPCVEPHLARYRQLYPSSSEAHYLYAMAILKRLERTPDDQANAEAESLLMDAVKLDAKCSDGYLELGVLASQQKDLPKAIEYYNKAINADPTMADAYYRLAKAYVRTGDSEKARAAFAMHDTVMQEQAAATQQQRKAVKQFFFANPGDAPTAATP